jgi:hypothetical protein
MVLCCTWSLILIAPSLIRPTITLLCVRPLRVACSTTIEFVPNPLYKLNRSQLFKVVHHLDLQKAWNNRVVGGVGGSDSIVALCMSTG